jgi:LPXTG-motif cell wall-anchored protein
MENINRHERRLRAEAARKVHYRMYKAGKKWVFAGVAVLSLGGAAVLNSQQANAATDASASSTEIKQDTAGDTGAADQNTDDATQKSADTANTVNAGQTGDTNADKANGTVAASTAAQTDTGSTDEVKADSTNDAEGAEAADATGTTQAKEAAAATPKAAQSATDNTTDIADAVSVQASAVSAEVQTGSRAGYTVTLNTTGIKTTLHNAKLVLNIPTGSGISLANSLASLAIDGVTPVLDATTGTLTYDFGTLESGISAKLDLAFDTTNALAANTSVELSGKLSADETTQDIPAASVKLISTPKGGATNVLHSVKSADGTDKQTNPIAGDAVSFDFGTWIPTTQDGTTLVKEGSPITVTYTLPAGMTYKGMESGTDLDDTTPTITPNTDGTTTLTWQYTAGDADSQVTTDFIKEYIVQAQIASTVAAWSTMSTSADMNFVDVNGVTQWVTPAAAKFTVTPQDIRAAIDQKGTNWAPVYTFNSLNGEETATGEANTNPDPTVYVENSPLLYRTVHATSNVAGVDNPEGTFVYYAVHNQIDPNETLQTLYINPATFNASNEIGSQPLTRYPYITVAVKYAGDGANDYHVLKSDVNTAETTVLQRADLVALGLDPTKAVTDVYLYYHMTADPSAVIPANVDTFFTDGIESPTTDANGKTGMGKIDKTSADYTGFPSDSGAPMGIYEKIGIVTSVNADFTGTITHSSLVQMDTGIIGYNLYWYRYLDASDYYYYGDKVTVAGIQPSTVEVAHTPTGVERDVDAIAGLVDSDTSSTIEAGNKVLRVQFTLGKNSTANIVTSTAPISAYVILPSGVTLNTTQNTDATVVDADYQGTGQQLVKMSFGQYIAAIGATLSADLPVTISDVAPTNLAFKTFIDLGANTYTVTSLDGTTTVAQAVTDTSDLNGNGETTDQLVAIDSNYILGQTNKVQTGQTMTSSGTTADGIAETTIGGQGTVTITTSADTDAKITSLDLLDVLPQKGATGLTTTDGRTTDYAFTLDGPITLPAAWADQVNVTYSTAKTVDATDASQWQTADAITDWSAVTAFRIQLAADSGKVIAGGAQTLSFKVDVPDDAAQFAGGDQFVADNTYSLSVNGLQATEPHAAQLAVTPVTVDHGTYTTTRTIHYQTADGKTLKPDTVQTVTYKTTSSSADGRTVYTTSGAYAGFTPAAIDGYTTSDTVPTVMPDVTDAAPANTEYTVVYTADALVEGTYATTRTIHFVDAGGTTLHPDIVQTLTYKTLTDQVNGRTTYTPAGSYASLTVPTVANYTPTQQTVAAEVKSATNVQPGNESVTVVYTKNANDTTTPSNNGGSTGTTTLGNGGHLLPSTGGDETTTTTKPAVVTTTARTIGTKQRATKQLSTAKSSVKTVGQTTRSLPQTGDNDTKTLTFIGIALASVMSILGLGEKRRRN